MNVLIIGNGYWGNVYRKTLEKLPGIYVGVCSHDYKKVLHRGSDNIDCVIIATPSDTHFQIIKDCLKSGKHVLVEKPFTINSSDTAELHKIIDDTGLILMVDHIYLQHEGILMLKKMIDDNTFGEIESIYSKRMGFNPKYPNALWEMGSHDLYIMEHFFPTYVAEEIKADGNTKHCIFNMQYTKILNNPLREHKINAHIEVCSYYPIKKREIIINGTKKRAILDDEADIKMILIDKKTNEKEFFDYQHIVSPLEKQCIHFFHCITNKEKPQSGISEGFRNVRSLEILNKLL